MKIWVDAQLSPAIAPWIQENFGIETLALRDVGLRDAEDVEIFVAARRAQVVVMSKDSDFVDLINQRGSPPQIIGRHDLLAQIIERWNNSHTPDSIILYGHRRMGKTSIIQNLEGSAPKGSLLVYLDLAGATATSEKVGDFLLP